MTLLNYLEALEGFSAISREKLPMAVSFKIASMIKEIKEITQPFVDFRQEQITNIQAKYVAKGEDVPEDEMAEFQEGIKKLLEEEVDRELTPVDLSECDIQVSPQVMSMCLPFIKLAVDADDTV